MEGRPKKRVPAFVTHVPASTDNFLRFWAQLDKKTVTAIEKYLLGNASAYLRGMHKVDARKLDSNVIYCAKFKDSEWYRCMVKDISFIEAGHVKVFFIDYGNTETVFLDDIRQIGESIALIGPQAEELIQKDLLPAVGSKWSDAAIEFCREQLLYEEDVIVCFAGSVAGIRLVEIYRDPTDPKMFGRELVAKGFGRSPSNFSVPSPVEDEDCEVLQETLNVGSKYDLHVMHVESPLRFWVHTNKGRLSVNWSKLTSLLEIHFQCKSLPGLDQVAVGRKCLARNESKDCFARGEIYAIEGKYVCKVHFIDYGNTETKSLDEVFASHASFTCSPGIAKCCSLDGMTSSTEDERYIFSLKSKTNTLPIHCSVVSILEDGRYGVELLKRRTPSSSSPIPDTSLAYEKQYVPLSAPFEVEVTHVVSATELYATPIGSKKVFNLLHSGLQTMAKKALAIPLDRCRKDMPCMIKVAEMWHRGVVTFPEFSGMVKVDCVDTGCGVMTPSVYGISPTLVRQLPAQAFKCSLVNISREEGRDLEVVAELKRYARSVLLMEALSHCAESDTYDVTLTCQNREPPVMVNLLLKQMFICKESVVIPPASVDGVENLFITAFESVHSFFGQLEKVPMETLDALQGDLTAHYGPATSADWLIGQDCSDHVGAFCCALYSLDKNFYRGRILSVTMNTARVLFVDYGNQEDVPFYNIKYLKPEFAVLPQFGITCSLTGHLKLTVDSKTVGNAITNRVVTLEMVGPAENHVHTVKFCESETDPALNKMLVAYGALIPKVQPILEYGFPDLANEGNAFICNFTAPIQFWVQFERNKGMLDEVTAQIEEYVETIDPKRCVLMTDYREGVPCLAKFTQDKCWYRSTVRRFIKSDNVVEVHFVDWGNVDKVPPRDVLPIPEHLMVIPLQAIECCFANIRLVEYPLDVLRELEQRLLDMSFPVNVLTHECPVKLEFKKEEHKAILIESNVIKTVTSRSSIVPKVNGNAENWGGGRQSRAPIAPTDNTPLMNSNPGRSFGQERNGGIQEDWDDSGGRQSESQWNGNPDRNRPDKQNGWSGSQHGSDEGKRDGRRGANGNSFRGNAGSRFVPPRMQRQIGQEGGWNPNETENGSFDSHTSPNRDRPFGREPEVKKTVLPPQPDLCGQLKFVSVVHVVNPGELYCQLTERREELSTLLAKLQTRYRNARGAELKLLCVEVGAVCCAQFSQDNAWYRAKVLRMMNSNAVVNFVDYGNDDTVPALQLKELAPEFLDMPAQAIKCNLEGLKPVGAAWTKEQTQYLEANVQNKVLPCEFLDKKVGDAFSIRLLSNAIQNSYETVTYDLMAHGLAMPDKPTDWKYKEILGSRAKNLFPIPAVEFDTKENATVTWVNNPSQFYCQLETRTVQLKDLEDELKSTYASGQMSELRDLAVDSACVALFCKEWYRATILAFDSKDVVVLFADYGNVETVGRRDVKMIEPKFMDVPALAYKCNLRGIRPIGKYWPKMDGRKFRKYFDGTLVCAFRRVCRQGFEIDASLNGKNIAKELVADKMAFAEPLSPGKVEAEDDLPISSLAALVNAPVFVPANLQKAADIEYGAETPIWKRFTARLNERFEVMFSYVGPPSQFFLQSAKDETIINALLDGMSAEYDESAPEDLGHLPVGSLVVAQFSQDEAWYRAEVLEEAVDERVLVKFIDFGNEDLVPCDKLRSVTSQFEALPQLAAECELHDFSIPADGPGPEAVLGAFDELIQSGEKRVTAEFKGKTGEKFSVQLFDDGKNVCFELLQKLGLPLPAQKRATFQSVNPSVGDSVQVYVSHINALSEFYVQRVSDEDSIGELQEQMNAHCAGREADADFTTEGTSCLAQFSDDNWYRAVVLGVCEEGVKVHFVDYGNSEVVSRDKLQKITEKFMAFPQFALKCALHGQEKCGETQHLVESFYEKTGQGATPLTAEVTDCAGGTFVVQLLDGELNIGEALNHVAADEALNHVADGEMISEMAPQMTVASFKEQAVVLGEKLEAYLSSITSPSLFYVQLNSRSVQLFEMAAQLDEKYMDSAPEENLELKTGMACVALYSGENWCRATVTEVKDELVTVFFVDYGNTESIPADKVRGLAPEFSEIPTFAFRCRLTGLKAPGEGDWSEELNEEFRQLLNYGETMCLAVFIRREEEVYVVRLLNMGMDVAESLVVTGLAEASGSPVEAEVQVEAAGEAIATISPRRRSPEDKIVPGCISNVVFDKEEALDTIDEGACDLDVDILDNPDETLGTVEEKSDGTEESSGAVEQGTDALDDTLACIEEGVDALHGTIDTIVENVNVGVTVAEEMEIEERPEDEQIESKIQRRDSHDVPSDCTKDKDVSVGSHDRVWGVEMDGGSTAMDIVGSTTDEEVGVSAESIEYVEMEDVFEKPTEASDQRNIEVKKEEDQSVAEVEMEIPSEVKVEKAEIKIEEPTDSGEISRTSWKAVVPKYPWDIPLPESPGDLLSRKSRGKILSPELTPEARSPKATEFHPVPDAFSECTDANDQSTPEVEEFEQKSISEIQAHVELAYESGEESQTNRDNETPKDTRDIPPPESIVEIRPQELVFKAESPETTKDQSRETYSEVQAYVELSYESEEESKTNREKETPKDTRDIPPPESIVEIQPRELVFKAESPEATKVQSLEVYSLKIKAEETEVAAEEVAPEFRLAEVAGISDGKNVPESRSPDAAEVQFQEEDISEVVAKESEETASEGITPRKRDAEAIALAQTEESVTLDDRVEESVSVCGKIELFEESLEKPECLVAAEGDSLVKFSPEAAHVETVVPAAECACSIIIESLVEECESAAVRSEVKESLVEVGEEAGAGEKDSRAEAAPETEKSPDA